VVSGITSATIGTSFAYIADVTKPEERARAFGLVGMAFGLGFVVGPAIGGLLGGLDPRLPFWVSAAACLANAAFGWFVLPESLPPEMRMAFSWKRANPVGALKLLASQRSCSASRPSTSSATSPTRSCQPCSCSMPGIATDGGRPPWA
jgi:DHA1 family tetracycline resistance protein-like MFS transporter